MLEFKRDGEIMSDGSGVGDIWEHKGKKLYFTDSDNNVPITADELRQIADKLDELNSEK